MLSLVFGEPLELTFVQEFQGNPHGFWRFRFYDVKKSAERVEHFPVDILDAIPDAEFDLLRAIRRRVAKAQRNYERIERRIIKAKLAGASDAGSKYVSDIYFEMRAGRAVPRLRIRERRPGEGDGVVQ
jgi:hypothetical protein